MNPDSIRMKADQTGLENPVVRREITVQEQADHLHLIEIEMSQCMRQSLRPQRRPQRHNLQCQDQVQMIPRE